MTKQIVDAMVLENKKIAKDIFQLDIETPEAVKTASPGQFVNVYLKDKSMLLPRPISICFTEKDTMTLIYRVAGKGTALLSGCQHGDKIRISTALGNGFQIEAVFDSFQGEKCRTVVLVGGGLGVPPMLELAKSIRNQINSRNCGDRVKLITVIGFMQEPFLAERFSEFCDDVHITTEDGSTGFRGNVLGLIQKRELSADYFLSCGPKPMLKALAAYCEAKEIPLQVSMEERMGCGYGACVGCVCKTKGGKTDNPQSGPVLRKKVCKDGPVFLGNEVIWDE